MAVEHTNKLPPEEYNVRTTFDRQNAKRQRISEPAPQDSCLTSTSDNANVQSSILMIVSQEATVSDERKKTEEALGLLAEMVVLFCEKQMFLPLLRAFELFLPLCPLLSLIRSLQVKPLFCSLLIKKFSAVELVALFTENTYFFCYLLRIKIQFYMDGDHFFFLFLELVPFLDKSTLSKSFLHSNYISISNILLINKMLLD